MTEPPEFATDEQIQRSIGTVKLTSSVVMAGIKGRLYKRESGRWRLLDNKHYATTREMTDANSNGSQAG